MTTASKEFEGLLRGALDQAMAKAPTAERELIRLASEAAQAVSSVTDGTASLELVPIDLENTNRSTYQLELRRINSEAPPSDLGVYVIPASGYPVLRWGSWQGWEARPDEPDTRQMKASEIEDHFRWMLSDPNTKLVVLVNFLRSQKLVDQSESPLNLN